MREVKEDGRLVSLLEEIKFAPSIGGKAVVTSWPKGLRNSRPNMLSEEFASYVAALSASKVQR